MLWLQKHGRTARSFVRLDETPRRVHRVLICEQEQHMDNSTSPCYVLLEHHKVNGISLYRALIPRTHLRSIVHRGLFS
jgi:hypothetical protein